MNITIELAQKLISIPSWVGSGCDEQKIGEFIYNWLRKNTDLKVIKQPVKDGRFNIIATDGYPTKLLMVGHIDTVETRAGWITNPLDPVIKNDRLYGLGATDMKGSLAALLTAVSEAKDTRGLMVLCYIDEEYDFAGMRAFVDEYRDRIKPKIIISLDGSAGQIGIGCRGLIEVSFRLRGKTGHAGRPELGVNAIASGVNLINKLKRQLATKYSDPILGTSTLNVAYCQGGLDLGGPNYGRQGNNIADLAEFVLDIRPAVKELTAAKVRDLLAQYARSAKLELEDFTVRHDLGSWLTPPKQLEGLGLPGNCEPSLGYIDLQMLWQTFGKVPCLTLGAGNLVIAHTPNEYVEINNLEKTKEFICQILK